MTHPIDIFQMETAGVRWLESAPDLEHAKARVKEFAANSPGEYVVLDQKTGNQIVIRSGEVQGVSEALRSREDDPTAHTNRESAV
jgi:hypothetical protein